MLKRWFTLLLIAMLPILAKAQSGTVYPIDLSVTMTPPYGTCLKEYVGSDRIVIQALLKDFSKTSDQFVIQLKVTDNRNRVVFLSWFGDYEFKPGEVFTFPMGPNASPVQKSNVLHDLFDPTHASVKLRNECFDEGAYTFTFQAFERASYPARKIALSLPFSYPVFLQGNTVQPLQIYPYENDVICNKAYEYLVDADNDIKKFATQLGGISYQWQSANPTGMRVGYHLQVVDLGDIENRLEKDIRESAQSAFSKNSYFPVNEIVFTPFYNHTITSTDYSENHAYAWRVRAVTGNSLTESLTYSKEQLSSVNDNAPVRVFYFCGAPGVEKDTFNLVLDERVFNDKLHQVKMDTIKASNLTANAFWRDSTVKDGYCGVNVEIRKKGQEKWTPYFVEKSMDLDADGNAVDNSHNFENLSYNTRYEVRAQYVQCKECTDRSKDCVYAPYSDVKEFLIPSPIDSAVCGDNLPKLTSCEEGVKVPKILAGDTIYANGAKVVVDEVSYPNASDSSIISGTAHLSMPIVKNIQLKMSFSEIQINCAKELVKGKIKSIWDEQTCAMINLDELTGQSSTGGKDNTPSEAKTDTYSSDPEELKKKPAGELLVDGDKVYLKTDNETGAVEIGTMVSLSAQEYQSKNYLAENSHYIEFYNTDKVNNAFDNDSAGWYRKMSQYDYFDAPNNKVILPWLANNPGKIKHIKAREVKKKETIPSFESVMFVIPSGGSYIQLKAEKEIVSKMGKNDTVYDLTVPGWADVTHSTPIFAIARKSDTSSFNDAGKMMVANYAERTHKLIIVPTKEEYSVDVTKIQEQLNAIYGRVGVTYTVEEDRSFTKDEFVAAILEDGLDIGADDESRWQVESGEMKLVRKMYAESHPDMDKKAAYLFLVNHAEAPYESAEGDMPRNQSVGYVFMGNKTKLEEGRVIAHELGHGVYKFQHTFAYKGMESVETDNIMDYHNGDYLAHYQWKIMQDSVMFVWGILQDDEDALSWKCAIDVVVGGLVDAGFEAYSQRNDDEFDFSQIGLALVAGAPSRIFGCFDPKGIKKVLKYVVDIASKSVKAHIKCNKKDEQKLDTYGHCMCEEFVGIATDQIFGAILDLVDSRFKIQDYVNNAAKDKAKKEFLGWLLNSLGFNYTVDQLSYLLSNSVKKGLCGESPIKKIEEPNKPNLINCNPLYYVETDDDALLSIYVETISKSSSTNNIGLVELESQSRFVESYCNSSTGTHEKLYWNNDLKYDRFSLPSEKDNSLIIILDKIDKDNLPHYNVSNLSVMNFDKLYLVYQETEILESNDKEQLYYVVNSQNKELAKVYKTKNLYKLRPSCATPTFEDNYQETFTEFLSHIKNSEWDEEIVDKTNHYCLTGNYCGRSLDDEKPRKKVVVDVYPKYLDDECSGDYNKVSYKKNGYIKNPFGQIEQVSKNEYKNENPRETNEIRLNIPKCSRWIATETGYKVSCVTVQGVLVQDLYIVNSEMTKVVLNQSVAKANEYAIFEYWGDRYNMIIEQGICQGDYCTYEMIDFDYFVNSICKADVQLSAFTALYVDYMLMCNGKSGNVIKENVNQIFKGNLYQYIQCVALGSSTTNTAITSNKSISKKKIHDFIKLLPEDLRNDLNNNFVVKSNVLRNELLKTTPDKFEKVINSYYLSIAEELSQRSIDNYNVKCSSSTKESIEFLNNFLSVLGWMIFNDADGKLASTNGNAPQNGISGNVQTGANYFVYDKTQIKDNLTTEERDRIRTVPSLLMLKIKEYLK